MNKDVIKHMFKELIGCSSTFNLMISGNIAKNLMSALYGTSEIAKYFHRENRTNYPRCDYTKRDEIHAQR